MRRSFSLQSRSFDTRRSALRCRLSQSVTRSRAERALHQHMKSRPDRTCHARSDARPQSAMACTINALTSSR
jgi:hypothetical protein